VYKVYIRPLINGNKTILKKEIEFNSIYLLRFMCFFSGLKLKHALINRFITLYDLIFISFDLYEHKLIILS